MYDEDGIEDFVSDDDDDDHNDGDAPAYADGEDKRNQMMRNLPQLGCFQ